MHHRSTQRLGRNQRTSAGLLVVPALMRPSTKGIPMKLRIDHLPEPASYKPSDRDWFAERISTDDEGQPENEWSWFSTKAEAEAWASAS